MPAGIPMGWLGPCGRSVLGGERADPQDDNDKELGRREWGRDVDVPARAAFYGDLLLVEFDDFDREPRHGVLEMAAHLA